MRTQEEIVKRIEEIRIDDMFGFQISELIAHLDYENAKPYLKDGITEDQWEKENRSPKDIMIDYMPFAWEKANDKRGISAGRSIAHYISWLWLDGDEVLHKEIDDYEYYGKPQLIAICKYLGIDHKQYDDGVREND